MFRYINSMRFYINSFNSTNSLQYPSYALLSNWNSYKQFWQLDAPPQNKLSFEFFFDLLYAPETIDLNSKIVQK